MLLRGMARPTAATIFFIIVTDMKAGGKMDAATEYFKFVCQYTFGQTLRHETEQEIQ